MAQVDNERVSRNKAFSQDPPAGEGRWVSALENKN